MYSMKSFATGVEDDDEEEEEEEEERRREKDEQGSPPQSSTPTLTLQPPTPLGFPASSRSYGDGEEVEEGGRDLFGEVSFHPERVEKVVGRERERTRSGSSSTESRPSRPTTSRRDRTSTSTSTSSSSFLPSPLSYTHLDDAYSGLAYDDPEPEPLPPPRFPSSSNSNSSSTGSSSSSRPVQPTTPTTTLPSNNVLLSTSGSYPQQLQQQQPSSRSFVPPHLRPFPKRPGSIVSNVSTSSKYSQASYRSEVDAPPPIIIPNPGLNSNSNSTSRPTSLFFSPSLVASPGSLLSNSSLTAPSSPNSQQQQQQYQTPFLPRPTSVLLDSFEGSTRYPSLVASSSAPPSIARGPSPSPSDANASRKSVLSLASFQGAGGGNEVGGKSRRASEGEEKRRRKVGSEAAGLSTVSTYRMPQVMGAAASLGEGAGSSLSGGRGYSTLTLPSGSYRPTTSHTTSSLLSSLLSPSRPLSVVGLPTTSLSTLSLLSSPPPFTTSSSATHPPLSVSYTSHTPPPTKLPSSSVLVRVWAIALDSHDAWAARRAEKGAVVGRSWVGKVVECGENAGGKGFGKGDWVYGLVNAGGGGGAAKEFLVVDRRALAACSAPSGFGSDGNGSGNGNDEWMTLEDLASLPLLGVTAHRSVGGVQRGSRALVLLGGGGGEGAGSDWGVGILAAQELLSKGVLVSIQVVEEWGEEWVREAVVGQEEEKKRRGLDVKVGEPMEVVNGEQEGRFEFVLDCVGGRRVYESSRRVLKSGGVFTSTKTDTTTTTTTTATHSHPTSSSSTKPSSSFLSLRLPLGRLQKDKKDKKKQLTSLVLPPSGSGPPVDSLGEDVRDILEWIAATKPYRPVRVGKVVPFERGGEAFEVLGGREGGGRRRYACEEEVWGVRLVG
ncbi:hypothetical protein BDY24DRAFT_398077 [Mrakia frigida]|uniref:uncharacterized protein n=1 Tax=Mrakia frigida TaxID=29902 RepID=UPI003FCC0ABF